MLFAVIEDGRVGNIIEMLPSQQAEAEKATGRPIIGIEGTRVIVGDNYNANDGKFYRRGVVVDDIPPVNEQIQHAIDAYTAELMERGVL